VKCIGQSVSEHKEINTYKKGRRKTVVFDDVDIPIPIERQINGEQRPMIYIVRKANEKSVMEITKEIREVQNLPVDSSTQILSKNLPKTEQYMINAPRLLKKFALRILRNNGLLKKKHMGTVGVTSIGMKGKFPGWIIPLGGPITTLVAVGGITKKPGVINDTIQIRNYLHLTITVDHDIVDGGPLARFVDRLIDLMENAYELPVGEKNKNSTVIF
jgi:pyruvate/2-oxoglutarate dehydrogenase complex dihydrolipoamide acyltransferase (E2) component